MSYIDDLNQAASEALAASASATESSQIIYDVANGDENTTVTTANGEVKTLAKAIADISNELYNSGLTAKTEEIVLSSGQTSVTLSEATTLDMELYVEGVREFDFTVETNDTFTLSEALPEGTRIWVVGTIVTGNIPERVEDIEQQGILEWSSLTSYSEGALCKVGRQLYQLADGGDGSSDPSTDGGVNWGAVDFGDPSGFVILATGGSEGISLSDRFGFSRTIMDFGGSSAGGDATSGISEWLSVGGGLSFPPYDYTANVSADDVASFLENIDMLDVSGRLFVTLESGQYTLEDTTSIQNDLSRVYVQGADPIAFSGATVESVVASTFSVKHWDGVTKDLAFHYVVYEMPSTSGVSVGDFIVINETSGDEGNELHQGCWEITDVDSTNSLVTVISSVSAEPPLSATCSGAVVTTTLKFLDGSDKGVAGVVVQDSAAIGGLSNMTIVGAGRPVATQDGRGPSGYDVFGGEGGQIGLLARESAHIETGDYFSVSGFSGVNVSANRGASITYVGNCSCNSARNGINPSSGGSVNGDSAITNGNLIDGHIAQAGSYSFAKRSVSMGNHRHGYVVSIGSSMNADGSIGSSNTGNGFDSLTSASNTADATFDNNGGFGSNISNGSISRSNGVKCNGNQEGGLVCTGGFVEAAGAECAGNTDFDYSARAGGVLSIIGHSTTETPVYEVPLNSQMWDGSIIRNSSSTALPHAFTNGVEIGGGGRIYSIRYERALALEHGSIPAGGSSEIDVSVAGVDPTKRNLVSVSVDSTSFRGGVMFDALVTATDTVSVRAINFSSSTKTSPPLNFVIEVTEYS